MPYFKSAGHIVEHCTLTFMQPPALTCITHNELLYKKWVFHRVENLVHFAHDKACEIKNTQIQCNTCRACNKKHMLYCPSHTCEMTSAIISLINTVHFQSTYFYVIF